MRLISNKIRFKKLLLNLSCEINQLEFAVESLVKSKTADGLYNPNIFNELSKLRQENNDLKRKIENDSEQNNKIIKSVEQDLKIIEKIILEN